MAAHGSHSDEISGPSTCAGAQSMVCEADEAAIDSRLGKIDVDDAGVFVAAVSTTDPAFPVSSDTLVGVSSDPPDRHRSDVPLHILYCVYRD